MNSDNLKPDAASGIPNDNTASCAHCGLPIQSQDPVVKEHRQVFCCKGCAFVYQMIQSAGLGQFYSLKSLEPAPLTPPSPGESRFTFFDSDSFRTAHILEVSEDIEEFSVALRGLHCAACVWLLENSPGILPGLISVRVDFSRSRAKARYNPQQTSPSAVAQIFDSLGYTPSLIDPNSSSENDTQVESRKFILQLGVAGFCASNTMILAIALYQGAFTGIEPRYKTLISLVSFILTIPAVTYSASSFYRAAFQSLRLRVAHIDLPISIAIAVGFSASTVNLFLGSDHIYFESICMLIFLLLTGRWLQRSAVKKAMRSLDQLPGFLPATAILDDQRGNLSEVLLHDVSIGDIVFIANGSVVPVDGVIIQGDSHIDLSVITGESIPLSVSPGMSVTAGSVNISEPLRAEVQAVGDASRIGRLLEQVRSAGESATSISDITGRLSSIFVRAVLLLAGLTFLYWYPDGFQVALDHTLALLIVTCPCALGLAVPITLSIATSRAASFGILLKSHSAIENICQVSDIYFDKTGTLTTGMPQVQAALELQLVGVDNDLFPGNISKRLLKVTSALELTSSHPYAVALREYCNAKLQLRSPLTLLSFDAHEIPGKGVSATTNDGHSWKIGSLQYLKESDIDLSGASEFVARCQQNNFTAIGLAENGLLVAIFALSDGLKHGALKLLSSLRRQEGKVLHILSGDMLAPVQAIAKQAEIPDHLVHAECSPEDKLAIITRARETKQIAMIGDGVNDAAALSAASVGIGVRGGAEACLAAADVFIVSSDCSKVLDLFLGAQATMNTIRRCLFFSLLYNMTGAALAISGHVTPLIAAILMPLSSLTVIAISALSPTFSGKK